MTSLHPTYKTPRSHNPLHTVCRPNLKLHTHAKHSTFSARVLYYSVSAVFAPVVIIHSITYAYFLPCTRSVNLCKTVQVFKCAFVSERLNLKRTEMAIRFHYYGTSRPNIMITVIDNNNNNNNNNNSAILLFYAQSKEDSTTRTES